MKNTGGGMITIESNIEFLNYLNIWLNDKSQSIRPPAFDSVKPNLDYAIESLNMLKSVDTND